MPPLTVEYAMEAISQAGTVMAVLTKEGVVMVAEKVRPTPYHRKTVP
jgi:20S proteasome alpha/beta subunit